MKSVVYSIAKLVCWLFFRVGFGLEVRGGEHVPRSGAFVLASNHVSYLDPPLLGVSCPRRLVFMAKASLFKQPLLGVFLRAIRGIPLQREGGDLPAMRMALEALRNGEPVAIFPEGGRQTSGRLGTAKRGVGLLAISARVPIVPALVRGTFEALPTDERRVHRAKIRVAFGPPIPYTDASFLYTSGPRPASPEGRTWRAEQERRLADAVTLAWRNLERQRQSGAQPS